MGSMNSIPRYVCRDHQDDEIIFTTSNRKYLLEMCKKELRHLLNCFERKFSTKQEQVSKEEMRIFQWNLLSQTLGTQLDNFVKCDPRALNWNTRRWRLLEEIIEHDPDIICLQEVDHFKFLQRALGSIGYEGHFVPKPDSPCLYMF